MSSVKVYIHIEESGYPSQTSKIQVPKSWSNKTVADVINLFIGAYNKKNPDNALDLENIHLALQDGTKIFSNDEVNKVLEDHQDYYIKLGVHKRHTPLAERDLDPTLIRCRNYGCNEYYHESNNTDTSCQHHTGPPIFHDTMKCWSCCRDRKAYDFESFQMITGCAIGRHSNIPPDVAIGASPNARDPSAVEANLPVLKSISDFNASNPSAVSATTSAIKTVSARKSTRSEDGLTARCQRKGCQKVFNLAENCAAACCYHSGQPVFHDAIKLWSCCPDKKCYDFDEFMAVKGCSIGWHDDGVIELDGVSNV